MENWNYAKLSVMARQNGGPEELLNKITTASYNKGYSVGFNDGYKQGTSDALCIIFTFAVPIIVYLAYKFYIKKMIRRFKKMSKDEIEEARKQIIEGINDYEKNHNN